MKKQLFNENWKLNDQLITLPRDEMLLSKRSKDAPSGDAQAFFHGGDYTYEKELGVKSNNAYLSFDGVYRNAKVYLNNELKASVPYGYIPFIVDLGKVDKDDVVKVECDNLDQPDSRWYSGAGIYRDVYLYTADKDYILPNGIKVETLDYQKGLIHVCVETSSGDAEVEVLDGDKVVASGKGNDMQLTIDNPKLWDCNNPNLYILKVKLADDEAEVRFGVRQVERRKDGIYVNGNKTFLKGGCIHHDNGLLGAATYYKSEYRRIKKLKEAGFNAIRSAHNPASEYLLQACDELGMYVMDETWDMWFNHKSKHDYATYWEDNYKEDIKKLVDRDYNHPSVILYSIGNEVSEPGTKKGIEKTKEMVELLHELDNTRLVTGGFNLMIMTNAAKGKAMYDAEQGGLNQDTNKLSNMNSTMFNFIVSMVGSSMTKAANSKKTDVVCSPSLDLLDIAGYNYASGRYPLDLKLHPERLIIGSETMTYDIYKNWKLVEELPNIIGDFMWTSWDYLGENGIGAWSYSEDAKGFAKPYPWWVAGPGAFDIIGTPNAALDLARATWHSTDKPLINISPINHDRKVIKAAWRKTNGMQSYSWRGCVGRKMFVDVYFDCARIDLYQNDKKVKSAKVKGNYATFKLNYIPGKLETVGYDRYGNEIARNSLMSASDKLNVVLRPEEDSVKLNDIVYVNVSIEDENGIVESNADKKVKLNVENGELLAFGSANPRLVEDIHSGEYTTYYGRALAIVKAINKGTIKVSTDNSSVEIKVEG